MGKLYISRFVTRAGILAIFCTSLLYVVVTQQAGHCQHSAECVKESEKQLEAFIGWIGTQISDAGPHQILNVDYSIPFFFLLIVLGLTVTAAIISKQLAFKMESLPQKEKRFLTNFISGFPLILWIATIQFVGLDEFFSAGMLTALAYAIIFAMSLTQWTNIAKNKHIDTPSFLFHLPASFAINVSGLFLIEVLLTQNNLGGQILSKLGDKEFPTVVIIFSLVLFFIICFQDVCEYIAQKSLTRRTMS